MLSSLSNRLHNTIVEVVFDKVDGTRRVMQCTLDQDYIKAHYETNEQTDQARPHAGGVLVVFDTEKNDWRSMRVDSIISFE